MVQPCAAFSEKTSVHLFDLDNERIACAVIENLNRSVSTHCEQRLVELFRLASVGYGCQKLLVG
jgi:hypothetical protein